MTFDEWLDEIENYGSRQERLGEELPMSDTLINWLRAAYEVGYEEGNRRHVFTEMSKESSKLEGIDYEEEVPCKTHPDAPHGFNRNASHAEGRYVCDCEFWEPEE